MSSRKEIQEELEEIAPKLAQMTILQPFSVPEDYFTQLPGVVAARIRTLQAATAAEEKEILSPLLAQIPKKMPFSVPNQYFEKLSREVIRAIPARTTASGPVTEIPVVPVIPVKPAVPTSPAALQGAGKVLSLPRRAALRMAAAAAAIVLIVAGVWMFTGEPAATGPQIVATADDSETGDTITGQQDLLHYMEYVSDAELIQYVEPGSSVTGANTDTPETAIMPAVNDEDLSLLLAGVSDQELENYLAISDI